MIRKLHNQLVNKEISAQELAEKYFSKIEESDKDIRAYLTVLREQGLQQAKIVDEKISKGESISLLCGIPCAIKDNICIDGVRSTAASKILDNYIAPYDATVIRKLREQNAVFLGKTNLDEFAMGSSNQSSFYQPTKNPKGENRVPGGSSGGSAAAVAAQEAVWALGSDTGGSIRQPAAFCGVVGLKPTYGRVSRYGLMAMASSLDQIGPIANSVDDLAIALSAISGEDPMDATSAKSADKKYEEFLNGEIKGKKIGIPKEYLEGLNEGIRKKFDSSVEKFKSLGAEVEEISLPNSKHSLPTYYIVVHSEVSSNMARYDGIKYGLRAYDEKLTEFVKEGGIDKGILETYLDSREYGLGEEVKRRVMLGTYALSAGYYDAYYKKAQKVRALIKKDLEEVFNKVDFIYSPTTPEPAFKIGEKLDDPIKMYLSDIYTVTANLSGVPAISFPIGEVESQGESLPVGGQIMGKWFDEEGVLNTAFAFEQK